MSGIPPMLVNQVVEFDALTFLRCLPSSSVGCFVTSPPYNLLNTSGGGFAKRPGMKNNWRYSSLASGYVGHGDNMPHDDYVRWQRAILAEMMRILTPAGVIFYNHKWRVQNKLLQDRADIVGGFPVRQIIIWQRAGGMNWNPAFFLPSYEVIYMIARPNFKLAKGTGAYTDVWSIPQEPDDHEAPFPLELARRCVEASGANIVCDPFMGRGTTARAAQILGASWLGCDINPAHVQRANKWTAQAFTVPMFTTPDYVDKEG